MYVCMYVCMDIHNSLYRLRVGRVQAERVALLVGHAYVMLCYVILYYTLIHYHMI